MYITITCDNGIFKYKRIFKLFRYVPVCIIRYVHSNQRMGSLNVEYQDFFSNKKKKPRALHVQVIKIY